MTQKITDAQAMVAQMDPALDLVDYCFVMITPDIAAQALGAAIATFREDEGVSAIIPAWLAQELGQAGPHFRRITLQVYSDLEGFGLTAAVAAALADAGIACNMVAAFHHDHAFVPAGQAEAALAILQALSLAARGAI
ncbi:ACT domain-containing protein [Pontixanthobacter gangjinensis]|uniref:ACT domain-containing protein n=1 Tax=Pontixanthobacter gangjinensis TaxID=1028742 RepID=A0A6I4SPX8_9SPHN|nr:ACT domain-containing protein [Pontixanthobacter gangjinensis]MXO57865.1 ACT domain-containing protein [Pontixanthobacter gangjinensis]